MLEKMTNANAKLTGATKQITLSGKLYTLSQMTDKDVAELDGWLQGEIMRVTRAALSDDMSKPEREEVLDAGLKRAMKTTWMSSDGAAMMGTPNGLARIMYQCAKRETEDCDFDVMKSAMLDPGNVQAAYESLPELRPSLPKTATSNANPNTNQGGGGKKNLRKRKGKGKKKRFTRR